MNFNRKTKGTFYLFSKAQCPLFVPSIRAKAITPEIDVKGNGVSIADGDTSPSITDDTDFGVVLVGQTATQTFTVVNTGTAWLYLGTPTIPTGFTRAADHLVTSLAPGASDTFSVQFAASAVGTVSGQISINNSEGGDDGDTALCRRDDFIQKD